MSSEPQALCGSWPLAPGRTTADDTAAHLEVPVALLDGLDHGQVVERHKLDERLDLLQRLGQRRAVRGCHLLQASLGVVCVGWWRERGGKKADMVSNTAP
jgi:hypothetical protein